MSLKLNTIPDTATCVFSGVQFRIWQWPQKQFDGSIATYEMAERVPTLWAIAVIGDRILMQQEIHAHKPDMPFYSLPGGKGEFDEDPLEGAKRELSEEGGYESEDWELIEHETDTGKIKWSTYVFVARNAKKTHEPHPDGGEKIMPILLSFDEFCQHVMRDDFRGFMITELVRELMASPEKKAVFLKKLMP